MAETRLARIEIHDGKGYVWDAQEALWLRKSCGLVGAMVGGVAGFKQQNAIHGLPLELSAEEVTLAIEEEWAELTAPLGVREAAGSTAAGSARKRPRLPDDSEFYSSDEELPPLPSARETESKAEPAWKTALASGGHFCIPVCSVEPGPSRDVPWEYPRTQEERQRYMVYRDLISKGFRVTGGSKFGADYLVYPGDPTLYHAQFCVRLCDYETPILPALLASACRGSHQARKHLLLASLQASGEVVYTTIGPVEGFG